MLSIAKFWRYEELLLVKCHTMAEMGQIISRETSIAESFITFCFNHVISSQKSIKKDIREEMDFKDPGMRRYHCYMHRVYISEVQLKPRMDHLYSMGMASIGYCV